MVGQKKKREHRRSSSQASSPLGNVYVWRCGAGCDGGLLVCISHTPKPCECVKNERASCIHVNDKKRHLRMKIARR